ncbi:MAG: hypothetical protein FWE69_03860, partial [Clostridiales bacterium]|nr:hypothetical protein [Clostridiales bacterium]
MADEFVAKPIIDTTDYKTGVNQLNRENRVIESSFRAVAASMDDWTSSADGLGQRNEALTKIIQNQKDAVSVLEAEHRRMSDAVAENGDTSANTAKEIQELEIKVNKAKEALAKSETELRKNAAAMDDLSSASADAGNQFAQAASGVGSMDSGMRG